MLGERKRLGQKATVGFSVARQMFANTKKKKTQHMQQISSVIVHARLWAPE